MPKRTSTYRGNEIAVIGMAGKFPGAENIGQFWNNLKNGVESISFFSDAELEKAGIPADLIHNSNYIKAKGVLKDSDCFDSDFFSYGPRDAERMDPQIRLLHECSWEALESAGYNPETFKGLIGAYLGANDNLDWIQRMRAASGHRPEDFDDFLINFRDYVSTRISYKLNLQGPSFTLLSACSTSLVSIHLACQALRNGDCDLAIAGGASIMYPEISGYLYEEGLMFSSDGHCRAFDEKADGTVFGDGVGVVVLKSFEKALKDRDHIHAVIRGSSVNNDGSGKMGFTTPSAEGQRKVIRAALKSAGLKPEDISYIETHGTGTTSGDPVEFEALRQAFDTKKKNFCGIGSVKTNIGHVNVAAGVSAFIKTVLSLENRMIPPSLHYEKPNRAMQIEESPFYVNNKLRPWKANGSPRRAGVSAFGFGGTNAHLILEESPRTYKRAQSETEHLLLLSAKNETALKATSENLAAYFKTHPEINLGDAAYILSVGRKHFDFRTTVVASNAAEAIAKLEKGGMSVHAEKYNKPVVFMFPGQGSQHPGMGRDLYKKEPLFREIIDQCAGILKKLINLDIHQYITGSKRSGNAAEEEMKQTEIAQPVIFVYSYALAKLLMSWGIVPAALIGHSLGEIAAACIGEVLTLEDALYLVAHRGKLMQQLPGGDMLAVPLCESDLSVYLADGLSVAAVNAPSLCVVSGTSAVVKKLKIQLKQEGIPAQYLATSHAFHSQMMDPALESFSRIGEHLHYAYSKIPIISTLTGDWVRESEMADVQYWTHNLRNTVRFSDGIKKLLGENKGVLLEVGPGSTLTNLTKMHISNKEPRTILSSTNGVAGKQSETGSLLTAVGKLWSAGVRVDWEKFYEHETCRRIPLPTYPFERRKFGADLPAIRQERVGSWAQLSKKTDVADWFYVPSWKRTPPPYLELNGKWDKSCWIVFTDNLGVADDLIGRLKEGGQEVITVAPGKVFQQDGEAKFILNPSRREDYEQLFTTLLNSGRKPLRILHLWTVTKNEFCLSREWGENFQELSFFSLLYLSQVIGSSSITDEVHISVISNRMHDVLGDEPVIPDKSTLLGPVKVIPQEYPGIRCCCIDVQLPDSNHKGDARLIDQILSEAITNSLEPVVAYRGENRWVQTFDRIRLEDNLKKHEWLREGGTYLITGGLGGLGLVLAEFFAKSVKANLVLTGRTVFPPKNEWDGWLESHEQGDPIVQKILKVRELESFGSHVHLITADVTDRDAMFSGIKDAINRLGPIDGVIHAAGVHGEGIIQLKKDDIAKTILAPKILGTIILDEILQGMDLDFFVLCSSISSFLGGIGLVDYCAANAFLDAYVSQPRFNKRTTMISINWDMWGEVGMGLKTKMPDELKKWLDKELRDGITSAEGVDVFQRLLTWNKSRNVIVSTRDLQARIDLWIKREFIKQKESLLDEENPAPRFLRPNLSTDFTEPVTEAEKTIAAVWGKLFGIGQIGRHDNFYELGGHSLLATTLVSRLKREFNTTLSIRDILDHPVLSELAEFVDHSFTNAPSQ